MSSSHRTRVAVIGGLSRAGDLWTRAGDALGVDLEHHDGRIRGRGFGEISSAVRRADVVVIITDPNSHGGVSAARRAAVAHDRPHTLVKRLRPSDLAGVIAEIQAVERAKTAVARPAPRIAS
ncbi:MAG TPA: DUF2325 domain-containing protein [Kofleriaceae bacterium]